MIVATAVRNPLDPLRSREIIHLAPGTSYLMAADILFPPDLPARQIDITWAIAFAINGQLIEPLETDIIPDECWLIAVLVPHGSGGSGGKSVLRMVASIVVIAIATYVSGPLGGGAAVGALFGGGAVAGAVGSALVMGTIMIAGSLLINALLPISSSTSPASTSSPTYSWDVQGNQIKEGIPVPELYGTCRVIPPVIGKYVLPSADGSHQTLNLLYAVTKWQTDPISKTDININNMTVSSIVNGVEVNNYPGLICEIRQGTNGHQPVIQAFHDIHADTPVGTRITTNWIQRTTEGNTATSIGVGIVFPSGLFHMNDDGTMSTAGVYVQIQYAHVADGQISNYDWKYIQQSMASQPRTITTPRWSGGYWHMDYHHASGVPIWIELAAGTTTFADHGEDDLFEPTEAEWLVVDMSQELGKPVCVWRWLVSQSSYIAAYDTVNNYITITGCVTGALRQTYYVPNLTAGRYIMQVSFYGADLTIGDVIHNSNTCIWEFFEEVTECALVYPNVTLVSISALATNQLSGGLPTVDLSVTRSLVYIWDPTLNSNTGGYVAKVATNPAWVCYDLIHKCRYIERISTGIKEFAVFGVPHTQLDYAAFLRWATWCDVDQSIAYPNKFPYTCNIYLDAQYNLRKALDMVGLCGRGAVFQVGSTFTCINDMPEPTPVQRFLFTSADIMADTYSESYIPLSDRANEVQITYNDATDQWKNKIAEVHSSDFNTTQDEVKSASIQLIGCTDTRMAVNYGKYLLNNNRYITATASWQAHIDAIACLPGDIIEVPRSLVRATNSGSLLSGCTTTVLTLDQAVTLEPGTAYAIIVRHASTDAREQINVASVLVETISATINLASAMANAPIEHSQYAIGPTTEVARLMRVTQITRASDFMRKITAVEFVNEVFDDSGTVPTLAPTPVPLSFIPPAFLAPTIEIFWQLDGNSKNWVPYVRVFFNPDPIKDYRNLVSPIDHVKVYYHLADGDTHTVAVIKYDGSFDWPNFVIMALAAPYVGKTLYLATAIINKMAIEGPQSPATALYVDTTFTPMISTSSVSITGYVYGKDNYTAAISWTPYGWALSDGKYAPITTWNSGNNYYIFEKYMVVWGFVAAQNIIPAVSAMNPIYTNDIGNIYTPSGVLITDATALDTICRSAATAQVLLPYSNSQWVAISVVPITKSGQIAEIDTSLANYGLDWDWIPPTLPGGQGSTVDTVQIANAELVYTMQNGSVFLNEMNWDYALQSPNIDGFAIFYRAQPYLWSWSLSSGIASYITDMASIIAAINVSSGGGVAASNDFVARYMEWYAGGIPYFYFMISDASYYEVLQVNTSTLVVTRGVEGTTAHSWSAGAVISYSACELIDTPGIINDTTQRSFTFTPAIEINCALHAIIFAFKLIGEAPGYKRCHYAYWDGVRNR